MPWSSLFQAEGHNSHNYWTVRQRCVFLTKYINNGIQEVLGLNPEFSGLSMTHTFIDLSVYTF